MSKAVSGYAAAGGGIAWLGWCDTFHDRKSRRHRTGAKPGTIRQGQQGKRSHDKDSEHAYCLRRNCHGGPFFRLPIGKKTLRLCEGKPRHPKGFAAA